MATRQTMHETAFTSFSEVQKFCLKLGTWNVRTSNDTQSDISILGRGHQLIGEFELSRYAIDLCCLSEVKWPVQAWHRLVNGS